MEFLRHCESGTNWATAKTGTPLDFIAFHAKGAPMINNGVVRMNMGIQLRQVQRGFELISSNSKYKDLPVIIGECDPEGCAACNMTVYPQNGYRNGTMYSSYTASSFVKIFDLAGFYKVNLLGVVSWSFEFENQPWFQGFRDLATNGVDKPVLNIFRMLGMMKGQRVEAISNRGYTFSQVIDSGIRGRKSDLGAIAAKDMNSATVMVWNYHDDDIPAPDALYNLEFENIPAKKAIISEYRIDKNHSNSYEVWKKLGSPQNPTQEQIKVIENAGQLQLLRTPETLNVRSGILVFPASLPLQGVSLFKIEWK